VAHLNVPRFVKIYDVTAQSKRQTVGGNGTLGARLIKSAMSLRERTRPGLGIIEPCLPSQAKWRRLASRDKA
jgi:hypothetical protein